MWLHTLKPALGSNKSGKRIGRGQGSGKGGTATRGHKGAQSRSGYRRKVGFEGGQLPLQRRLPRYGFKSPSRIVYTPINLSQLQWLAEEKGLVVVDHKSLVQHGLVRKNSRYKILGKGDLKVGITVSAHAFSASARAAVERLGGRVIVDIHA